MHRVNDWPSTRRYRTDPPIALLGQASGRSRATYRSVESKHRVRTIAGTPPLRHSSNRAEAPIAVAIETADFGKVGQRTEGI